MLGFLVAAIVTICVAYLLYKKYKPQAVLFFAGIILLGFAIFLGPAPILNAKQSTGLAFFDVFESVKNLMSSRLAGLGLTIMSIGGFVRYMEACGANRALVGLSAYPLKFVKSPMAVMMMAYVIGHVVDIFVPSHAGLGLLLMLTLYPIMVSAGVNKLTAVAVLATAKFTDIGPISSNAVLAAHTANLEPVIYFLQYQLPVVLPSILVVGILHCFVQPWWERREGRAENLQEKSAEQTDEKAEIIPPAIYAILPMIPLALVIIFCPLFIKSVKMDVITAMVISTVVAMIFELVRKRKIKEVLGSIMVFFDGMAKQFTLVVSLIICAELFGLGLQKVGAIDSMIVWVQEAGLGLNFMILVLSIIMAGSAFIMGSGNAAFFAFAGLVPKIAVFFGAQPVVILLVMELTAGYGRCMSPITAAIVAMAAIAGVSPFDVAKRCAIPVFIGLIVNVISIYFIHLL